jgi:hypothetical protein
MKGTVYIVNYAGQFDFVPAKKFGKLKAITKGKVNIFDYARLAEDVKEKLKDFNHKTDFLLFCGSTIINVAAVLEVMKKSPYVKVLVYGTRDQNYAPVTINRDWDKDLDELDDLEAERIANGIKHDDPRQPSLFHHTIKKKE